MLQECVVIRVYDMCYCDGVSLHESAAAKRGCVNVITDLS